MKLRNKIAAITAAAMLAFTGVGFAAWTFTKTVEDNTTATGDRKAGEGIFYCTDLASPSTTKIPALKLVGQIDHIKNDLHYGDVVEQVEFKVAETNNIPVEQVSFSAGAIVDSVQDIVVNDNEYEAIYTLPTLDYVAAPTTLAELTAFDTAVSGKTISLVFTFGIKAQLGE